MGDRHPTDDLRLKLVGIRADLRMLRSTLARTRRMLERSATLRAGTVREREQELCRLVDLDPEVMALEDRVLRLQESEDRATAELENENRVIQKDQWLVRQQLSDGLLALATGVAQSPVAHLSLAAAQAAGERSAYLGESDYILERELS